MNLKEHYKAIKDNKPLEPSKLKNYKAYLPKSIRDDAQDHEVDNRVYKAVKFSSPEEANKFLEENPDYGVLDIKNQEVFVALKEDKGKETT